MTQSDITMEDHGNVTTHYLGTSGLLNIIIADIYTVQCKDSGTQTLSNITLTGTQTLSNITLTGTQTLSNITLTGTQTLSNITLTGTQTLSNTTVSGRNKFRKYVGSKTLLNIMKHISVQHKHGGTHILSSMVMVKHRPVQHNHGVTYIQSGIVTMKYRPNINIVGHIFCPA